MKIQFALVSAAASIALAAAFPAGAADADVENVVVKSVAHFDFGATSIQDADRDALLAEVAKQKNVTWQTVTATGYTDSVGSLPVNRRLSQQRAAAVKQYLVGKGLDGSMIHALGKADANPVAPNSDESGRAQNRRTDIEFRGIRTASSK
jgi:OOP family OmpA-OmpF porin